VKKYRVYTDIHNYANREQLDITLRYLDNSVFLGDIWDVNCRKKDAKRVKEQIQNHIAKCMMNKNLINVRSNHHGRYDEGEPIAIVKDGILFCHAHTIVWDKKKVEKWHNKKAGIRWYKFLAIGLKNKFTNGGHGKISSKTLEKLAKAAEKYDCNTIVCGHFHKSFDGEVNGIRVVVCNRGVTDVEL
jgi:predicted phosphodiesterase